MLNVKLLMITCLVIVTHTHAYEGTEEEKQETEVENRMFANINLLKYGYAKAGDIGNLMTTDSSLFQQDLKDYQSFAGIDATGVLDAATMEMMHRDRCGDKDPKPHHRVRRWRHQGSEWRNGLNMKLRWKLLNKPSRGLLNRTDVLVVLRQAFALWSNVTNLEFTETPSVDEPEIIVKFDYGSHGDPYPFDGRGGVLAHAFYPHNNKGLSGDVHFDDDETYSAFKQPTNGDRDLMWVATHEIGHSIGLEHSSVRDSIMYPWYPSTPGSWTADLKLKYDDINGIQNLYGGKSRKPKTTSNPNPKPKTTTKPRPLPVNGGWSKWSLSGSCSKSCDGGLQLKTRTCTNPSPSNGGRKCPGNAMKQIRCNAKRCPTVKPPEPECKNRLDDTLCNSWKKSGRMCNRDKSYWKVHCYKTCSGCGGTPNATPDPDETTTAKPAEPECTNQSPDNSCKSWKKSYNMCNQKKSYWQRYCYKECSGCKA